VTAETFAVWRRQFEAEMHAAAKEAEEAHLHVLGQRERDEAHKWSSKPTGAQAMQPLFTLEYAHRLNDHPPFKGRQLFERSHDLDSSDAAYVDEGDVAIDASQYERARTLSEEKEDTERLVLSDSE
jgi:hypothetical protein